MEFEEYLKEFSEEEKDQFKQQLTEWKEQYDGAVFVTEINDIAFIWRGLTKAEFKRANEFLKMTMNDLSTYQNYAYFIPK
ncbi:hypothetical protein QO179_24720 [Bacillus stercoris]|nr:hypothetical protein [Bacillus stercoris]